MLAYQNFEMPCIFSEGSTLAKFYQYMCLPVAQEAVKMGTHQGLRNLLVRSP
jgi:hypothetical protein